MHIIGRLNGSLTSIRVDDLAAIPLKVLIDRNAASTGRDRRHDPGLREPAGGDDRDSTRMAVLLVGLPETVSGSTINRLCGAGLGRIGSAGRAFRSGDAQLIIAGGVESTTPPRSVMRKAQLSFDRAPRLEETTLSGRFVNPATRHAYRAGSML